MSPAPAYRHVRVAAAQLSGGIFDRERAIERVLDGVANAARDGVELLVFPESFIGGYPYWRGHVSVKEETELAARLYENSITGDSPDTDVIADQARQHGVAVVVGANERHPQNGAESMYNVALVFHPEDGYLGSHRKLVPTHTERAYWAYGDERDLASFTMPFAQVGALICYEHHMLLARMAMALGGEQIHCALWPGYWETLSHIADKKPGPTDMHAEIDAVVRDYAISTQNFVVSANAILAPGDVPRDVEGLLGYNLARGGSSVVDASGRYLAPPVTDVERLVIAEIDLAQRTCTKSYLDTIGHYARWDLFGLRFGSHIVGNIVDHAPESRIVTTGERADKAC